MRRSAADQADLRRFYESPWFPANLERLDQSHQEWQTRLAAQDFAALPIQGRIDYLLQRNQLAAARDDIQFTRKRLHEIRELLPFLDALAGLEVSRVGRTGIEPRASASALAGIPAIVKTVRERIKKPGKGKSDDLDDESDGPKAKESSEKERLEVTPVAARRAAKAVQDLRGSLKSWFTFYDGYQPDFSWWVKKPYEDAAKALEDYAKYLKEEIAGLKDKPDDPLLGEAVGGEILARQLQHEMIPYSPRELIELGEAEFAWCEKEMKRAAHDLGLGDDWKKALDSVKSNFAPPGGQDEAVAAAADDAIEFLKRHELVSIPKLCEETWRLSMVPPDQQRQLPYVAYGGQNMMVAYAREEMKHEDKLMSMRGNNRHFTRIVTAHELIPGHHLQAFHARRYQAHRSGFSTPFFVEGWALYWELRLWDLNYARSPEERIGMLFWRMHRTARIVVSLKFHLGEMTPSEMIDFLVDKVGHERFGATSEVRRYIAGDYSPLYQCAYMVGGMQLHALHRELVGAGRMSDQVFNDTVLTYNAIPVELIRAGMLSLPLAPDTKPAWRFRDARSAD